MSTLPSLRDIPLQLQQGSVPVTGGGGSLKPTAADSSFSLPDSPPPSPPQPRPSLELTPEQLQERESQCRELIETIRHENFGIGLHLEGEQELVAAKQREREGRGIQRLSLELYSKDTHFVLELIQNADDNSYPAYMADARAPPPSLNFLITEKVITVLNNEVGFSEGNIRAICDVGKSTKGAHRAGYIGQKGIGFKSVFRVTHRPAIHSNGYHICFDASSDPIGFILPHWCAGDGGGVEVEVDEDGGEGSPGEGAGEVEEVSEGVDDR